MGLQRRWWFLEFRGLGRLIELIDQSVEMRQPGLQWWTILVDVDPLGLAWVLAAFLAHLFLPGGENVIRFLQCLKFLGKSDIILSWPMTKLLNRGWSHAEGSLNSP